MSKIVQNIHKINVNQSIHDNINKLPYKAQCSLSQKGKIIEHLFVNLKQTTNQFLIQNHIPLISCLMITRDRIELVKRSVLTFQAQTYPKKRINYY